MEHIFKSGNVEIYRAKEDYGFDYYVYGVTRSGDPRVVPSEGMARSAAATALTEYRLEAA